MDVYASALGTAYGEVFFAAAGGPAPEPELPGPTHYYRRSSTVPDSSVPADPPRVVAVGLQRSWN